MNVIGIIQTDLNEFSVLFEPEQGGQQNGQGQGQQSQQEGAGQNDDSMFLSFLEEQTGDSSGQSQAGNNGSGNQQQNGPQELTVRIKGIPEGQKANFLQMYQIIQDAKDSKALEQSLTIVNNSDQQNQGAGNNNMGGSGNNGGSGNSFSGGSNSSKNQ
ncbi:hypothetical protein [Brevibacillus borstelensis]|uniref:hypothetical protein n=1 Tax=Brevibacillus borstelensis TaxID=45462 RepID=UPI0030BBC38F